MRTFISILAFLICTSYPGYSQSFIDSLKSDLSTQPCLKSTVINRLASLKNRYYLDTGEIDFGFGAKTLLCTFGYKGILYYLSADFQKDTIFVSKFESEPGNLEKGFTKFSFQFIDSIIAGKYLEAHNTYFQANCSLQDLNAPRFEIFGITCGYIPRIPESMFNFKTFFNSATMDSLVNLSSSIFPTDRAFGSFGLYIMKQSGIILTQKANQIFLLNKSSLSEAITCAGCIYGTRTLKEILTDDDLESYYTWFKQFK